MAVASPLADPVTLDDLLLYRLGRVAATAGTMVIRLCEGRFGITRREWRVIALLAHESPLLSSELADRIRLDRARTSRAVTSMVEKGLLQREPGAADRRQARLALTGKGRAVHEALFPLVRDINRELLAALPEAGAAQLQEALEALQQRAESMLAASELPKADRSRGRFRHPVE